MQKLEERNTYAPTNAPQVCSNCDSDFKQSWVVEMVNQNLKTFSNNSDVDQRQHTDGLKVKVYVLNKNGKPLMPCKPAKARHLLKQSKAKVVTRKPFTIQLLWDCENNTQPIKLGIDSGYKFIGFSATTNKEELISGEVTLRTDIKKKLENKSMYRRMKRNKLWYRPARFLNRSKKEWIAPSIKHKLDTHIRLVNRIKQLLPITETTVEVASFDIQKMENPEISGVEYQQGTLQGYNIRQYLLEKFNHKCVYCGKKDIPLEIEHLTPKSCGGSDRLNNLAISCHDCNQKKGNMTCEEFGYKNVRKKADKTFKDATFMSIIRWKIVNELKCKYTYGYITKSNRIKQGLEKSHINDAFIISGGTKQNRCKPFIFKQIRRNNRCLQKNRKGYKPSIRRQRHKIQVNDLIETPKGICRSKGITGYKYVRTEYGPFNVNKIKLICYGKGLYLFN